LIRLAAFALLALGGCANHAMSGRVPIEIVPADMEAARVLVPCRFDAIAERCYLDTGATYTSVQHSPASALYPDIGIRRTVSAAGHIVDEDKIHIERFSVGPIFREHFEVARYGVTRNQATRVGIDLFASERVRFHFDTSELRTCSAALVGGQSFRRGNNGLVYVPLALGGREEWAIWDTGAEITTVDRALVKERPELFEFVDKVIVGYDATGARVAFALYRTSAIEVDGHSLSGNVLAMDYEPLRANLTPGTRVILGTNLLKELNWDFDFKLWQFRSDTNAACH
jgi:hypothetical protein